MPTRSLPVSGAILNLFLQTEALPSRVGTGRDIPSNILEMKFVVTNLGPNECDFNIYSGAVMTSNDFVPLAVSEPANWNALKSAAITGILTYISDNSLSMTAADIIFPGDQDI